MLEHATELNKLLSSFFRCLYVVEYSPLEQYALKDPILINCDKKLAKTLMLILIAKPN